ncbi:MAG: serine dehydratase [Chloroflexi bacterium]|nr:serine dehydratase [Chloroflexota bacterium]
MRGPSSSHCAAAVRIGRLIRDLMDGEIKEIWIEFDSNGSLARTHVSQGSDMGLFGGLLGWEATDVRLTKSAQAIRDAGIQVHIDISDYGFEHPNTYRFWIKNSIEQHQVTAISTGGGMIEIIEIDGLKLSIAGDYYETLVYLDSDGEKILSYLTENTDADDILLLKGPDTQFIEIKAQKFLEEQVISELGSTCARSVKQLFPVLPVLSRKEIQVPFITCEEMLEYNATRDLKLWELALHYESARGNVPHKQVFQNMKDIVRIMFRSILQGISGTEYADRILGYQSGHFLAQMENKQLLDGGILNQIILFVTAMMEMKSSMGVIVAAPTAGACGGLPGACIGAASAMGLSEDDSTKAMLAAGMIGVFIAAHATFAAEIGGCQAECGAGSGMAAAALVTLGRGSTQQAIDAASMALQNIFGMVCDPVASRVEVPCLGKNVMAASNALACANMALANFDAVIPLDQVIDAMDIVGKSLPYELRCTALGGLSVTRTSQEIEKKLGH